MLATATDAELAEYAYRSRPLGQFICDTTPGYEALAHQRPLMEMLERVARGESVNACVSMPPRHGKTDTLLHGLAWLLVRDPTWKMAFVSYAADFAAIKCNEGKTIAKRAGVPLAGRDREDYWETAYGGLVRSAGSQGQLTGTGYRLVVVDDPIKNMAEAESQTVREKIIAGFSSDIYSRQAKEGTAIIVCQTRWHVDDLYGQLVRDGGWESINLPAIDAEGRALWPDAFPVGRLAEIRRKGHFTDYQWSAMYEGSPVPRGGALFGPATYCERREVPRSGIVGAFGCDLAYSGKTHSDFSAVVVLVKDRTSGTLYVADVLRVQRQAAQFAALARERVAAWPGVAGRWYTSTTERGTAELLGELGLRVRPVLATGDKFVRAQPVAAAWQAGRVRVPRDMPWTEEFVREVTGFTGLGDRHDDQVDALAAAFDEIEQGYSVVKLVRAAKGL